MFYPWGWENVLGEEMATHSSLLIRNPMDRGAWQATLHTVAKSWTQWKQLSMYAPTVKE